MTSKKLSRRDFLKATGAAAAGAAAGLSGKRSRLGVPTLLQNRTVRIAAGGWAEQNMKDLLEVTNFTGQTGIDVEVVLRTDTKETELTRIASVAQAGTSPYDVIDFEDELTTSLSQAGYVIGLDDTWDALRAMRATKHCSELIQTYANRWPR